MNHQLDITVFYLSFCMNLNEVLNVNSPVLMVLNKWNPWKAQTSPQDLPKVLPSMIMTKQNVKTENTYLQYNSCISKHFKLQAIKKNNDHNAAAELNIII